jgi:hypothetical protein
VPVLKAAHSSFPQEQNISDLEHLLGVSENKVLRKISGITINKLEENGENYISFIIWVFQHHIIMTKSNKMSLAKYMAPKNVIHHWCVYLSEHLHSSSTGV